MKKLIVILCFGLGLYNTYAQAIKESLVPVDVVKAFGKAYPSIRDAKWNKEKEFYEVSFKQKKKDVSVLYDVKGLVKEIEQEIQPDELPAAITKYLAANYPGYKVEETASIIVDGVTTYEVEIEKEENSYDLIFNAAGSFVKKLFHENDEDKD